MESLHYDLCHQEPLEVREFVKRRRTEMQRSAPEPTPKPDAPESEAEPRDTTPEPTPGSADKKMRHLDFFAMCRAPGTRDLAPFPEHLKGQCGIKVPMWKPRVCLRQLALIELVDKEYQDLPLDHEVLLSDARCCRALAECKCELFSGRKEAAAQRLIQYFRCTEQGHANARFQHLGKKDLIGDDKEEVEKTAAERDLAVQARLRDMVVQLAKAFDKNNVKMKDF